MKILTAPKPINWQFVFIQSKVNGATYFGEYLPVNKIAWPKQTWLKKKLAEKQEQEK